MANPFTPSEIPLEGRTVGQILARGAVEVPVNLAFRKNILRRLCNDSTAKTIIIDGAYLDRLEEIEAELEHLQCVVLYSEQPDLDTPRELGPRLAKRCRLARFEDLLSANDAPF